jgi:DNA polymerase-3 subunit delta
VKDFPVPPLLQPWFSAPAAPAYLLAGDGAGLADLVAELVLDRFRAEGATAELSRWTAADLERESPEAAFRTPSFFFRFRIFALPDLGELKKAARDPLQKYLAAPEPSVVLVIPCSDRGVTKTFSAIPGIRAVSPREEQVISTLAKAAVARMREAGKALSDDGASFLVRWVGMDFARLKEELGKLVSYSGGRKEIGEEEIRAVCIAGGAVDPFRLAEKLVRRDRKECLAMFRRFAAGADSADYHGLVGAIAWYVRRRLADRSAALSPRRGGEILAALSMSDMGLKGESRLSPEQLFEIRLLKLLA